MIRNQFHLVYLVIVVAGLAYLLPSARRQVLAGALPAIVIATALFLKNWILFGAFASSTWLGMNTGVSTTFQLSPQEADRLIEQGIVSPLARIVPFSDLRLYYPYIKRPAKSGIPVLDQEVTSTGHANFNNLAYLQVHDLYFKNSAAVLVHYPIAYVRSVLIAWFAYFLPASDYLYFDQARAKIRTIDYLFDAVLFGQFRHANSRRDLRAILASGHALSLVLYTGIFLMILLPVLVVWASVQLLVPWRRKRLSDAQAVTLAFMLFTILFVTAVSNLISSFENNRYRFPVDGYYVAILGMMLASLPIRKRGASNG
jgi:hypothetical protein